MNTRDFLSVFHSTLTGNEFTIVSLDQPERTARPTEVAPAQRHTTVMYADIVDSTEKLAELGDHKWLSLLSEHYTTVRDELRKFQGWYLSVAGDGFLAAFADPARALECGDLIRKSANSLGLRIRIGVHGGSCLSLGRFLGGLSVHIVARIASTAAPDQILVSEAVRNELAGSKVVKFADHGTYRLKGVPGFWRLYLVH